MSDKTLINLLRIRACDEGWNEADHPRADNGQFTSGGGGGGANKSDLIGMRSVSKTGQVMSLTPGRKSAISRELAGNYYLMEFADKMSGKINSDNWENGKRDIKEVVDYKPSRIDVKQVRKTQDEVFGDDEAEVTYEVEFEDRSVGHKGKPVKKTITQKLHDLSPAQREMLFGE